MKKFNINIQQDSFWYIVTYSGIICLLVLVGIFPLYHYNSNLMDVNKKLKNQGYVKLKQFRILKSRTNPQNRS